MQLPFKSYLGCSTNFLFNRSHFALHLGRELHLLVILTLSQEREPLNVGSSSGHLCLQLIFAFAPVPGLTHLLPSDQA